jgi:hypothetical protein
VHSEYVNKKILIISKEWSPENKTGLGFSSLSHAKILKDMGCNVTTVGINHKSTDVNFDVKNLLNFLTNYNYFLNKTDTIINKIKPDIIIVESLQTVISEIFLMKAQKKKIKTIIISHGISVFPYKLKIKYILRFLAWFVYIPILKKIFRNSDLIMSLDLNSLDYRHYDTNIAKKYKKKIISYNNFSRFENYDFKKAKQKKNKKIILCLGYVNHIKNQNELVEISKRIKDLDIEIKIIFNKYDHKYLNLLKKKIKDNNLRNILLFNEREVSIVDEIINSWFLINVSITEVSPLSLIEGNSLRKFFLSYDVGSINKLKGGIINQSLNQIVFNIRSLNNNNFFNERLECTAKLNYLKTFNKKNCQESFVKILEII